MKIEHVALWTTDIERLRAFYETYFQAKSTPKYTNEKKQFHSYFLTFSSGARLELMQRPDIRAIEKAAAQEYLGYAHLALAVGSEAAVDGLTKRLIADGYARLDGPRRTGDGYYESVVLDPEGNRIEITV
jgi:lactoylglutathione lyase